MRRESGPRGRLGRVRRRGPCPARGGSPSGGRLLALFRPRPRRPHERAGADRDALRRGIRHGSRPGPPLQFILAGILFAIMQSKVRPPTDALRARGREACSSSPLLRRFPASCSCWKSCRGDLRGRAHRRLRAIIPVPSTQAAPSCLFARPGADPRLTFRRRKSGAVARPPLVAMATVSFRSRCNARLLALDPPSLWRPRPAACV